MFFIVFLPVGMAIDYLLLGINSVQTYTPPIGDVMDFVYRGAILFATVLVPVFALLAFLYSVKRFRKYIDKLLEYF